MSNVIHILDTTTDEAGIARPAKDTDFSGGGDASAENQLDQITAIEEVRDRLPTALVGDRLKVTSQDTNGEGAVTYITNTTPVTGLTARQVVCLTDTVFATFTRTNSTGSITGVELPAGTLLPGPVTAITLTSGAVAAYA